MDLNIVKFSGKDFKVWEGEENIVIIRTPKHKDVDVSEFYQLALEKIDSKVVPFELKQTERDEFESVIEQHFEGLNKPPEFQIDGEYLQVFKVLDNWNEIRLLAETTKEFVLFLWFTTA